MERKKISSLPSNKAHRILITGGGTGGHVFPAIAIANELRRRNSQTEILFVGAQDRLEMQKVPEAGYPIEGLWISGFQRDKILRNILLPVKVISSLMKARRIIKKFHPQVVVGVGGYASGATLYVAHSMKVHTVVQEQNSFAGITNKIMRHKADRFCVAYDNMERFFPKEKIIRTGNPVRSEIVNLKSNKTESLQYFGLKEGKKTILVIGGSLGARTINQSIDAGLEKLTRAGFQIIWQTGKWYINTAETSAKKYADTVKPHEFIKEMSKAYDAADIIVSRAGALSIAELALVGKPCVLVPSPNVAEDHQTKNAMALVDKDAALYVSDAEARSKLIEVVLDLVKDDALQRQLGENILKEGHPDATEKIVDEILALAR